MSIYLATEHIYEEETTSKNFEQTQVQQKKYDFIKKTLQFYIPPETRTNDTCTFNYKDVEKRKEKSQKQLQEKKSVMWQLS